MIRIAFTAAASAAVYAAFAVLAGTGASAGSDRAFTVALQSVASYPLDVLSNADTLIGQATVTAAIGIVLAAVAWRRHGPYAALAPLLIGLTVAIEIVSKGVVGQAAPPKEFTRAFVFGDPLGTSSLGLRLPPLAYPSGHIARITFLSLITAGLFPNVRALRMALAALVAVTFWARIYIGDHWLSDAVGGLALGIGIGCCALLMIARARR